MPKLKIVMEHLTTADGVDFVLSQGPNVAATITPQHLIFNRNGEDSVVAVVVVGEGHE